ncbi:hypothetical protein [Levilactobacillus tujiorum]|uniref:Integral membrane protein n=1 Tax=Levilactobacillus tujiorum TaxID=2912243 RepID=A0ABX1L1Z2_9LACO|nr:hypothetical protein [Levilactobacillus tujiorum]MCH5464055.1 hypothetical protein [Levilactobacillus tujiorum]NLR11157.1 hypothetical protein [Lactobacillus sp. HBUAS51387]NLR29040.1 hypothetical protein [Levilactobacillus tujiorum]
MKDRNVIAWAIISLFGFLVINFLMSRSFVGLTTSMSEFWRSSALAVGLYAITIVLAALDWRPSFYLMGLVIGMYTLSLISVLITMWSYDRAALVVRLLMSVGSIGVMVANAYWLVLALRLRKDERDKRDRKRFGH